MRNGARQDSLHVCYICGEYPPARNIGGIGVFVQTMARALVAAGHRTTVVGLYDQPEAHREEYDAGVRVIRLSAPRRFVKLGWLINRRRLLRCVTELIDTGGVDLVEAPDYEGHFWMAPTWGVPKVVRIQGGEVYFRRLLGEPLKLKHRIAESRSMRHGEAFAAVTRYAWERTRELFGLWGQTAEILPNPVDCDRFAPGAPDQVVPGRLLYSGTFIRKKGVLDLFSALPQVFDAVPQAHLVCVGPDAPDTATRQPSTFRLALERLPEQHRARVQLIGAVPHHAMAGHLRTAAICVYPSILETQGIVWVEAMACARPIVASLTGTGPEIIEDGVSGALCHPGNHERLAELIVLLLQDRVKAEALGAEARRQALTRFALGSLVHRNVGWYRRVIEARRAGSRQSAGAAAEMLTAGPHAR